MTDQEQEVTEEQDLSAGEADEKEVEENEENEEVEQEFVVLCGHYKFGGRNKTYGIFELIGEQEAANFDYVNLGSSTKDEIYDVVLDITDQEFREQLKNVLAVDNSQDKKISREIKKNLIVTEVVELLTSDKEQQVKELIEEIIEDEQQEEIKLELKWDFISESELAAIYPEKFAKSEADEEEGSLGAGESLSDYSSDEGLSSGLDVDLKLNCSPVISAISGKLITSFSEGDEILVRITDKRDLTGELKDRIKISNGLGVGTIEEIEYKEGVDRYQVLVQLGEKIYGNLTVGPKVMLSHPESQGNNIDGEDTSAGGAGMNNQQVVIFTIVGLFIVIIILLLLYL
ncbi:MAG: hypothetical protein ACQERJ_05055 [Bacillota bacterium]